MNHSDLNLFNSNLISSRSMVANIVELTISRPTQFEWQAGDYLWLGSEESNLKPFSIANVFDSTTQEIQFDIALNDGLADWWQALTQQQKCVIKGPVKQYQWPSDVQPVYLLAGGTGITPLLALLKTHQPELSQRKVTLFWGVRHSALLFVRDQLDQLSATYPNFNWQAIVSEDEPQWTGEKGNLPDSVMRLIPQVEMSQWIICGPWPMVTQLKQWLISQGVSSSHIQ